MSRNRRKSTPDSLPAGLAKGALAGLLATLVMEAVDTLIHRLEPESSRRRTRAVRPNGRDPVHNLASQVSEAIGRGPIPEGHPGGRAAYFGAGLAAGALYGAFRGRVPGLDAGYGSGVGVGRFVLEDKIYTPLAGTAAAPWRYPWQAHARQLAALVTHGVATDLLLRAMTPAPERRHLSVQARAVAALPPLTGMKRDFRDEPTLRRDVARRRPNEPHLPSRGMRERLSVTESYERGSLVITVEPRDARDPDTVL